MREASCFCIRSEHGWNEESALQAGTRLHQDDALTSQQPFRAEPTKDVTKDASRQTSQGTTHLAMVKADLQSELGSPHESRTRFDTLPFDASLTYEAALYEESGEMVELHASR